MRDLTSAAASKSFRNSSRLLFGLVIYTAAFIAEVVRAGLMSVSRGQIEAAAALGLRRRQALKLVIIPQAKRVIIPPLTNQYLNLTKNSSLAVAIGYPDFVQIFTGTVLNQTGQAVEVVAITLAVYLALSLAHLAGDELLSVPRCGGAAMTATNAPTGDASDAESFYVMRAPARPMAPPITQIGVIGWLRANLFSSLFNALLTVVSRCAVAVVRAADHQISVHRCGVGRRGSHCMSGDRRFGRSRGVLGLCAGTRGIFRLRIVPIERTVARRCVFRFACVRHRLDGVA